MLKLSMFCRCSKPIHRYFLTGRLPTQLYSRRRFSSISGHYSKYLRISGVTDIPEEGSIRITWSDDTSCDFPHIFLRDNCQCPTCFHPTSKQRLLDLVKTIDVNIQAESIKRDTQEDSITVNWPDSHKSVYKGEWLRARKFPVSMENAHPTTLYNIRAAPWSSTGMTKQLPLIDYDDLMSSDKTLLRHFENLFIHGLSIIKESPTESGLLHKLTNRVSHMFIKKTHYGEIFTVKSKPSPNNLAYTASYLPLHVDLPFYTYQPEIQNLHCIEQSDGENSGTSLLSDGFRAAEQLRTSNPDLYQLLTTVKFKFNDVGRDIYGDYNMELERPIIGLDRFGNFESISYNNHVRSSYINVPSDIIKDCYKAYYALSECIYGDILHYKMVPGDILCFNNKRLVHGRTAFDHARTTRWLEGCYMDLDELYSIYRVVRERTS